MAHLTTEQIATLKNEIDTDPTARGYAAPYAAGNDGEVARLCNEKTAAAANNIPREPMLTSEIVEFFNAGEWDAMNTANATKLAILLSPPLIKVSNANVRALMGALWPVGGPTRANLAPLGVRVGSRAEALFGANVSVDGEDVSRTRF